MKVVLVSKKVLIITLIVFVVILLAAFEYNQYQDAQNALKNPNTASQKEVQSLVEQVSKLIDLPTNETPQVATVSDKEKLKNQAFFAKAEIGDKVLIYSQNKKAVLFRPKTAKIIEVSTVNIADQQASGSANLNKDASISAALASKPITAIILNGTQTKGLAAKVETDLKKSFSALTVKEKSNSQNEYDTSEVVILNEDKKDDAQKIADYLKAKVVPLPDKETKPTTGDLLILVGKDKI